MPQSPALRAAVVACVVAITVGAPAAIAAPQFFNAAGANPAAIQPAVDAFRDAFEPNNGVGGSFAAGRREVNWDGVPDNFATPNLLPPNFFNVNSPRGIVFNTVDETAGAAINRLLVSADASNPDGAPPEFGDINAQYPGIFQPFSPGRLMIPRADRLVEITFFVPGTAIPATVAGFAMVFSDVDTVKGATVRYFAADGSQLTAVAVTTANNGLSFHGVRFTTPEERIARVIVRAGNVTAAAGTIDGGGDDVVAMDDVFFAEPRPQYELFEDEFENAD